MSPLRRRTIRRLITWAILVVTIVVVVLLVMIGFGVLVLPSSSSSPVTITEVQLRITQGTTSSGAPWLGPSWINYTAAEGYPIHIAAGKSWSVTWLFSNFDSRSHNITSVDPSLPFGKPTTQPTLPYTVGPLEDEASLTITLTAPSTPGATYVVTLSVGVDSLIG